MVKKNHARFHRHIYTDTVTSKEIRFMLSQFMFDS